MAEIANQQRYKGADDWRVPNVRELETLVKIDPAWPAIDLKIFPNVRIPLRSPRGVRESVGDEIGEWPGWAKTPTQSPTDSLRYRGIAWDAVTATAYLAA
ncbi:TPA: DUF1566 domain-containing protein [Stenotrophomonas maltophilia]|nr:DUF1566 domain-containing protein [Stenotrophomonas maltophilia]